jgi:hypothetical protein
MDKAFLSFYFGFKSAIGHAFNIKGHCSIWLLCHFTLLSISLKFTVSQGFERLWLLVKVTKMLFN